MPDGDDISLPLADNGKSAHRGGKGARQGGKLLKSALLVLVFIAGAGGGAYLYALVGKSFMSAANAPETAVSGEKIAAPVGEDMVFALGRLLPHDDLSIVSTPYGAGDARLETLLVAEGDRVKAGQVIATLDNRQSLRAAEESARAQVALRQAALEQVRAAVQAGFLEARATYGRARAAYRLATAELKRVQGLREKGVVSQAAMDKAETTAAETLRELERSRAALSLYEGAEEGLQTDILLAERNLDAAEADLRKAHTDLAKADVVANTDAVVIAVNARIGERPGVEGVALLGDTDKMKVELEVYQSDIRDVAVGQPVEVTAAALGDVTLTGEVTRLGLQVKRQQLVASDPAANTDARVIPVTVALDPASSAVAASFTGLQVKGRILTRKGR